MNARLEKGYQRYEADLRSMQASKRKASVPKDLEVIGGRVSRERGKQRQLEEALRLLHSRADGTFTSSELVSVLAFAGWEDHAAADSLRGLLESGRVAEVRPDMFRLA
jgi:hypothetical protein